MSIKKIEINSGIYPSVMSFHIGNKIESTNEGVEIRQEIEPEISLNLPRDAYLIYLQTMANEKNIKEMNLLEKYAYGVSLNDADYYELISFVMTPFARNWSSINLNNNVLATFGLSIGEDNDGKKCISILDSAKPMLRAGTWEGIIIDMLNETAMSVINLFDFENSYNRKNANTMGKEKLQIYLGAWKFSMDESEQCLSNALRSAFIYTLVGYYCGDRKELYSNFQQYFEEEFYKRVSLVYGIWTSISDKSQVRYVPLYDSFHNLKGADKEELIKTICGILDNSNVDLYDKEALKNQLIDSAGKIHTNISESDFLLEQNLIKPAVNFVILRDKAKERLQAAKTLEQCGKYKDCANRCYYAMMDSLKSLLEHKGLLPQWKENELKERETHNSLERALKDLVRSGVIDEKYEIDFKYVLDERMKCDYSLYIFKKADAQDCINRAEKFINKVEQITA